MLTSRVPVGTNVFEKDWDVLILLDTCRVDAIKAVQNEYDFLENIQTTWSVGSTSKEWVEQTFTKPYAREIATTAYITGNPFSTTLLGEQDRASYGATHSTWLNRSTWADEIIKDRLVDIEDLGHMEALWGSTGPNAPFEKSQHPDVLTDYTIQAARSGEYSRVIAHYIQPHSPYFSSSKDYDELKGYEKNPFEILRNGSNKEKEQVWEAYLDNLRYALDHVEILLDNIDGRVIITADHGELLDDQGMYYHMPGNPHPKLKKVPWVEVEAVDKHTISPDISLDGYQNTTKVSEEQLEALGYI